MYLQQKCVYVVLECVYVRELSTERKRDKDIRKRQLLEIIKEDQEKAKGLVKNEM